MLLVTAVSRVMGPLYTYTTLQPIQDACAGNATPPGMTDLVLQQNTLLDYGDFRLWRYSDDAKDYGADWLAPGLHTFAVEVHQNLPNSSDVIFGAELRIIEDASAPALTITRSATGGMQLSWPVNPIYSLYQAAAIAGPFTPVANDPQGRKR